jgi:hypothetical protein
MPYASILLLVLLLASPQDPAKQPSDHTRQEPAPAPAAAPPPAAQPQESPFQADEALRKLLDQRPSGEDFEPLGDRPALPEMRLRGLVRMKGKEKPAALIELKGIGTFTAREGEKLSFSLPGRLVSAHSDPGPGATRPNTPTGRDGPAPTQSETSLVSSASHGVVVREQIPIALRIERVAPDGVLVEVGTLGQFVVIR